MGFAARITVTTALLVLLCASTLDAQKPQEIDPGPVLTVGGEVRVQFKLTMSELSKLPHKEVHARDHDGQDSTFSGVPLVEILKLSGVPLGEKLRGQSLGLYLVVEAADGYRAVFALAELDPAFTNQVILLADHRDGKSLPAREGPWRIIVPGEKRQARWVRQVASFTIQRA